MSLRAIKPLKETQTRILDAAEELFMLHGFEGASMRMLTAQARSSRRCSAGGSTR
jgi:AcrR family transcriptional regulator